MEGKNVTFHANWTVGELPVFPPALKAIIHWKGYFRKWKHAFERCDMIPYGSVNRNIKTMYQYYAG